MGLQAMASQSLFPSLSRRGSIYSLTLNEVQTHLGEPLHSMNLDELLKNVIPAEAGACLGMNLGHVQRQGIMKTVDEVWRDIQKLQKKKNDGGQLLGHERQPTLGEMTLEDFLTKAGVITEGTGKSTNNGSGNEGVAGGDPVATAQSTHWLQQCHQMQQQQQTHKSMMGDYVQPKAQMSISNSLVRTMSEPQSHRRKRGGAEIVAEKGGERRQKRMIKNRESAARSRARKQAYINELENKISHLEQENESLRKQKELDCLLPYITSPEVKYQLRRSRSFDL